MRKAYDLLRRLRADDGAAGRPEERLREWTNQAAKLYREGLKAQSARAIWFSPASTGLRLTISPERSTTRGTRRGSIGRDPDLPAPSDDFGLEDTRERAVRDLRRAYDRITWLLTWRAAADAEVYVKAARDLYNAARRDLEGRREERAGELARASEAMTHVPEHLAQIGEPGRPALDRARLHRLSCQNRRASAPQPGRRGGSDLPPILPPE